jgi:fructose-1,6-bisphosphatase/inositol monophosphatase family enzyme
MAAGELIAREAGAITSDFAGGPAQPGELLASAPGVHAAVVGLLERV